MADDTTLASPASASEAEAPAPHGAVPAPITSINLYGFAFGVFGIVALSKVASYLTPYKLYFSFSSFMYDDRASFKWEGLGIKLLVPCAIGFFLFYLPFRWMIWTRGSSVNYRLISRYLLKQARLTALASGFFAALLMAWPFIAYWDILQRPDLVSYRLPFLCVYFLYFVSYAYFAGLGVALAQTLLSKQLPLSVVADSTQRVAWLETVRVSTLGIATSAIATFLASMLALPQ